MLGEAVNGRLRPHRIREGGEPLVGAPIRGHDDGPGPVALEEELVDVAALGRVHGVEAEVIEDEEVDGDEPPHLGLDGVIEARVAERLEQAIGADGEDGGAARAGEVAEGMSDEIQKDETVRAIYLGSGGSARGGR